MTAAAPLARIERAIVSPASPGVTVLDGPAAGFAAAGHGERAAQTAIRVSAKKGYPMGRDMAEIFAWLLPTAGLGYGQQRCVRGQSAPFRRFVLERRHHPMAAAAGIVTCAMGCSTRWVAPGGGEHAGSPVDLGKITSDAYIVAASPSHLSRAGHYRHRSLLGSKDNRFVLSFPSGHIAGACESAGNPRRSPDRAGRSKVLTNAESVCWTPLRNG